MRRARHATRGQAFAETVFFIPVFLILIFGIIWTMQLTVLGERSQVAVRYSGLISNEADPMMQYSLYAMYNSANAALSNKTCTAPTSDALNNGGNTFPGPPTAQLWYSAALINSVSGTCTPGVVTLTGGTLVTPSLFSRTQSTITTILQAPSLFPGAPSTITATQNVLRTPDVAHLMTCYGDWSAVLDESLKHATLHSVGPPLPLPAFPPAQPLSLTGC